MKRNWNQEVEDWKIASRSLNNFDTNDLIIQNSWTENQTTFTPPRQISPFYDIASFPAESAAPSADDYPIFVSNDQSVFHPIPAQDIQITENVKKRNTSSLIVDSLTPSENIQSSSNTSKPTPFTDLFSKVPQKQSTPAGLAKRFGFKGITIPPSLPDTLKLTIDFQKREKIVTEMAHKNTVSLLHIQTLFSSLLDDRDNALIKTQKTCSEKTILVDKISRLDSQINKLMASKQKLEVKLSEIVEIETNQLETLENFDSTLSKFSLETKSFETRLRSIKKNRNSLTIHAHKEAINCLSTDITAGKIITGSLDKTCKIFDLDNRECLAILYGHSCPITSSSINSGLAVSGCEKSVINLWKVALLNPSTESKIYSIHFQDRQEIDDQDDVFAGCFTGHSNTITALELQENTLLSGSLDKTARQWDIETGTCISILRSESAIEASRMSVIDTIIYGEPIPGEIGWSERSSQIPIYNVSGGVSALQFWMHALAVGYNDGSLRLFDLRSVSCTRVLKSHSDVITSLKFDSNTIVTASQDHTLNIWDLRMGIVTETIEFSRPLSGCCFDSRKVYVAGERDLKVYDRSSAIVDSWKGHVSIVSKVEKYGVDVISAGRDGIVKLWS